MRSSLSCHLFTDGPVMKLHKFADRLYLKADWFQDDPRLPHYDLSASKRRKAIRLGAKPVGIGIVKKLMRRNHETEGQETL